MKLIEKKLDKDVILQISSIISNDSYILSALSNNKLGAALERVSIAHGAGMVPLVAYFFYSILGLGDKILNYLEILPTSIFENATYLPDIVTISDITTKVSPSIFRGAQLTKVEFNPNNTVLTVPVNAFADSTVKEVVIGEGIQTIERGAFANCEQLEVVTLPQSIKNIVEGAFSGCNPGVKIRIPTTAMKTLRLGGYKTNPELTDFYKKTIKQIGQKPTNTVLQDQADVKSTTKDLTNLAIDDQAKVDTVLLTDNQLNTSLIDIENQENN